MPEPQSATEEPLAAVRCGLEPDRGLTGARRTIQVPTPGSPEIQCCLATTLNPLATWFLAPHAAYFHPE